MHRTRTLDRLRAEEGASLVETALVSGLFLVTLIGIMQMCIALYAYHYVAEAARLATRYAMVRGSSCGLSTACPAQSSDIQTYVRGLGLPGITPANMTVTTTWPNGNGPGNQVVVRVQYSIGVHIPFRRAMSLNLASTSQATISQ